MASNISRAVYRLLHALEIEKELEEKQSQPASSASDRIPRLQQESRAEREFRISIALEMGGLVRGYQDCLVFVSTSQPVFNREKFLKRAPALFIEEPSGGGSAIGSRANKVKTNRRILSSRSKRFLSILVNCQHFHQFLETLRNEECSFFHEVMEMWIKGDESRSDDVSGFESSSSFDHQKAIAHLTKVLQNIDDRIATYTVKQMHSRKPNGSKPEDDTLDDADFQVLGKEARFPRNLLKQIDVESGRTEHDTDAVSVASKSSQQRGVHHASLSVQYLVELEKNPWRYQNVLDISIVGPGSKGPSDSPEKPVNEVIAGDQSVCISDKVRLRDALGDRKYRAWKLTKEKLGEEGDFSASVSSEDNLLQPKDFGTTLDLASLMTSATEETVSDSSSQSSLTNLSMASRAGNTSRSNLTSEQQRVANAKDRDVLRRCLEKAYSATKLQYESNKNMSEIFSHHGRDLVSEAEIALRNPSAQHFLLSLLSKRSHLDKEQDQQMQQQSPNDRRRSSRMSMNASSASSSLLEPIAFECVVRLCCAMLDSCMETKDYEPAYLLLCHTAGLFTLHNSEMREEEEVANDEDRENKYHSMYMTARIGLHPLFADLGLWLKVMSLHLAEKNSLGPSSESDREKLRRENSSGSLPSFSQSESFENEATASTNSQAEKQYEAAVATLYDMLGYSIPAEELARFATKVSQDYGWFAAGCEKGQSLLLLARRLSMRRELGEHGGIAPGEAGDLDMMLQSKATNDDIANGDGDDVCNSAPVEDSHFEIVEIGWCHPAAPPSALGRGANATAHQSASGLAGLLARGGGQQSDFMTRSAVTALATLGSSVVVSGGLDGGVFLAHTAPKAVSTDGDGDDVVRSAKIGIMVRGLHLDWGSSGSRVIPGSSAVASVDGEYGVGAVSCLAAASAAGGHQNSAVQTSFKDVLGLMDEEDMIREMEGSRIVAGTTCGDLRIWSVKDIYAAMHASETGDDLLGNGSENARVYHSGSDSTSSNFIPGTPGRRRLGASSTFESNSGTNNPFNRLKFSLRGRALSGHRGGVTCIDVPSHVYRPDSVVTGGADGLIKLWSLRTPSGGKRSSDTSFIANLSTSAGQLGRRLAANRGGDALSVLNGHGGRVLCVKTAWHGDRLLSGGADRTIRIWDLMGTGNSEGGTTSLHTLSGHFGWVTHVNYWGPNTIVSGSTDRAIALWDARVRDTPLFVLRHHHAPISDLLVGQRTDPLMVSAASDGSVVTWDFRHLSGASQGHYGGSASQLNGQQQGPSKHCKVVRQPAALMDLGSGQEHFSRARSDAVLLARGEQNSHTTVVGVGNDAIMRKWDISTGRLVKEWNTGHCDTISTFTSLADATSSSLFGMGADSTTDSEGSQFVGGTLTSSWDGTIRMRKRIPKQRIEC